MFQVVRLVFRDYGGREVTSRYLLPGGDDKVFIFTDYDTVEAHLETVSETPWIEKEG